MAAEVTVFVDDAVRGRFPHVCAKTGTPSAAYWRIDQPISGLGLAWLLLLLGPIGWVAFLVLAAVKDREVVSVRLPYSDEAAERLTELRRSRTIAALLVPVPLLGIFALGSLVPVAVWFVFAGAIAALAVWFQIRIATERVTVSLDASRRWVTLGNVSPAFASAVRARSDARQV